MTTLSPNKLLLFLAAAALPSLSACKPPILVSVDSRGGTAPISKKEAGALPAEPRYLVIKPIAFNPGPFHDSIGLDCSTIVSERGRSEPVCFSSPNVYANGIKDARDPLPEAIVVPLGPAGEVAIYTSMVEAPAESQRDILEFLAKAQAALAALPATASAAAISKTVFDAIDLNAKEHGGHAMSQVYSLIVGDADAPPSTLRLPAAGGLLLFTDAISNEDVRSASLSADNVLVNKSGAIISTPRATIKVQVSRLPDQLFQKAALVALRSGNFEFKPTLETLLVKKELLHPEDLRFLESGIVPTLTRAVDALKCPEDAAAANAELERLLSKYHDTSLASTLPLQAVAVFKDRLNAAHSNVNLNELQRVLERGQAVSREADAGYPTSPSEKLMKLQPNLQLFLSELASISYASAGTPLRKLDELSAAVEAKVAATAEAAFAQKVNDSLPDELRPYVGTLTSAKIHNGLLETQLTSISALTSELVDRARVIVNEAKGPLPTTPSVKTYAALLMSRLEGLNTIAIALQAGTQATKMVIEQYLKSALAQVQPYLKSSPACAKLYQDALEFMKAPPLSSPADLRDRLVQLDASLRDAAAKAADAAAKAAVTGAPNSGDSTTAQSMPATNPSN